MPDVKPSEAAMQILREGTITATSFKINSGQLARPVYEEINKVLAALGGKWDKKSGTHLFSLGDPREIVAGVLGGTVEKVTDIKQDLQFYATPFDLVDELCMIAGIGDNMRVLEPSAGTGNIANVLSQRGATVDVCEIHQPFCEMLTHPAYKHTLIGLDFLSLSPGTVEPYDAVVMNPPFTKGQDVEHVTHAYQFLRPGGILVSIMSAAVKFNETKKYREFREFAHMNGGRFQDVDAGSFKESGTGVNTVIFSITRQN